MDGLYKRPPRLKFTDEERENPELQKKVQKADKTADKADSAQRKIPSRKKLNADVVPDPKSGKLKVKLQFEESRKKPPSKLTHAVQTAPGETVRGQLHKEVHEIEDDNVGVEAAHALEQLAERTSQVLHAGYRSHKLKPYREAAKVEQKLDKANLDALQKKMDLDHPTSNPYSKFQQRQAIKRQYAAAKAGSSAGTTQTAASITEKAAKKATETSKKTAAFVKKHSKAFLVVLGLLMLLGFFLSGLSSCTVVMEGVISGIASSTYASTDDAIRDAEATYCAMEDALQRKLNNYEANHSYDDYIYDLDEIGHDPYVLTSILSALHPGEWTLPEVMGTLDMLFEKQYILTEEVETEIRYRTETLIGERHAQDPITGEYLYDYWGDPIMEEYEYEDDVPYTHYTCTVTLENFELSHVPVYVMTEEELGMYAVYMSTLGNRPDLFPGSEYIDRYDGNYPVYEIPPEALEDADFAAMITEAEKYLGYPYVWGGSSPSTSFDCSGFVSWVINHSGWNVGRLSAQGLCNICTPVSSSNVKPGDLVFFKGTYDTPGVSHVGIYVGNSRMIHCGDPISYTNLNSSYWQSHFYTYGRLP